MSTIIDIQNEDELRDYINNSAKLIIKVSATWCYPCKLLKPKLEKLSEKYTDVQIINVDVDKIPGFAHLSLPRTFFYVHGVEKDFVDGDRIDCIQSLLELHFK